MIRFIVDVVSRGAAGAKKDLLGVADATNKVGTSHNYAEKSAERHFDTQAKGVIGTANSTRSFSKLAQTINGGGSSSVVGAYATLASNIFALTALFNALKHAAQVDQVEKGLEALGARIGQTLTTASADLKKLTDNAISNEQAMRSAAQVFSAGFKSNDLEKIGEVAKNASFALGREMTDSMDRLTRGVIKLEPELLDELGIMTRLGEATALYAAQTGKVESRLTTTERRQAFLNAVLAEGQAKFGGLADAAGNSRAYDQLSATIKDLTKDVLAFINQAALPLAGFFANNPMALTGGAILFASTIRSQLLPGLDNLQKKSIKTAEAYKDMAAEQLKTANRLKKDLASNKGEAFFDSIGNLDNFKGAPAGYKKFLKDLDDGNLGTDEEILAGQNKAVASLERSINSTSKSLAGLKKGTEEYAAKSAKLENLTRVHNSISTAIYTEAKGTEALAKATKDVTAAKAEYARMTGIANAQEKAGRAIQAANVSEYREAIAGTIDAVKEFHGAQKVANTSNTALSRGLVVARTAMFGAATGAKVLGSAMLNMIPIIGQAILVASLLKAGFDALKTDRMKAIEEASKSLAETNKTLATSYKEIERVRKSSISIGNIALKTTEIEMNIISELAEKLVDLQTSYKTAAKEKKALFSMDNFSMTALLYGVQETSDAAKVFSLSAKEMNFGINEDTKSLRGMYNQLKQTNPEIIEMAGGQKALEDMSLEDKLQALTQATKNYAGALEITNNALKKITEGSKQAGAGLDAMIKKATGGTSVDDTLAGLDSILSGYGDSRADPAKREAAMLSLDSAARKFLDTSTQQALIDQETVHALSASGMKLTENQKIALELAEVRSKDNTATADSIAQQLRTQMGILEVEQRRQILSTAQANLANAMLSRYAESYALSEKGLEKQNELQNQAVQAKIDELKFGKILIDIEISRNNAAIALNKSELEYLELKKKGSTERQKELADAYELESIFNRIAMLDDSKAPALRQAWAERAKQSEAMAKSLRAGPTGDELRAIDQEIANRREAAKQLESNSKTLNMQAAAVATNIAAAGVEMRKSWDVAYDKAMLTLRRFKDAADHYNSIASSAMDIADIEEKRARLRRSENESLITNVRLIRERAILERNNLDNKYKAKEYEIQANLIRARADANRVDEIPHWERQLANAKAQYDYDVLKLENTSKLTEEEQYLFNTRSEGLEMQKKALSYLEKQASVQAELTSSTRDLATARENLARKQQGYGDKTRAEEMADAIKVAAITYEAALNEAEIKKATIDLEYALLEAQARQLKEQLLQTRALTDPNDTVRMGQLEASLGRLDNAISNMPRALESAKRVIDNTTATARVNLQTAITPQGSLNAYAYGERALAQSRAFAQELLTRKAPEALAGAVTEPFVESQDRTSESIEGLISSLDSIKPILERIADNNVAGTGTTTVSTGRVPTIKELGEYIQSQGFRVSEQVGFGGVTPGVHRGRGHAEGRAVDVNIGYGNIEANNPQMRARMDALERDIKAKYGEGIKIIWKSAGHFNHMHVEIAEKAAQSMVTSAQKVADEAITQLEDIVVTAPRGSREVMDPIKPTSLTEISARAPDIVTPLQTMLDLTSRIRDNTKEIESIFTELGSNGAAMNTLIAGVEDFSQKMQTAMHVFKTSTDVKDRIVAGADVALSALGTVQSMLKSGTEAKIALVDQEIAAEQRRDGKSAESVAKLASLEKKKDTIARKSFEVNKKIQMAQAIIATASGVAQALSAAPVPYNFVLAGMVGAMGAAQLAMIAGTSYQSTASANSTVASSTGTLAIGKRGDSIDVAKNNPNAGGEIGYLRGSQGRGSNGSNYNIIGSAYGGRTPRGYGNTAYAVGEKGPEVITPDLPMTVRPLDEFKSQQSAQPVHFNINALDAKGVEDILYGQRGNIIGMLREAANANGQSFLEDVNVNVYTKPNVGRL